MPPRRAAGRQGTQQQDGAGPGPSSQVTFPEYVGFAVVQTMLVQGCLPEADVKAMIRRLAQRNTDDAFRPVLSKIQQDLGYLEMSIERIKFPMNDGWYICLVNKEADEASKNMGGKYSAEQLQFFSAVVEVLGKARRAPGKLLGEVDHIGLVNADVHRQSQEAASQGAKRRRLGGDEKTNTIKAFARDGWLFQTQDGYYTFGPRALGELKDLVLSVVPAEVAEELQEHYM